MDGAPYRLEWEQNKVEAEFEKQIELKLSLVRRIADWKNDVTIQPFAFPGNFKMSNSSLAGDQAEMTIKIDVQANTKPGGYKLAVLGQSQVSLDKDHEGNDKPDTLVSLPSQPITITVKALPAVKRPLTFFQ
ncbi:MAG: hypothetical protein ABGZ53_30075 [Fuerstiella sp.]